MPSAEPIAFELDHYTTVPKTHDAPECAAAGVQSLYFESVPYHGRPTRVFAYMGLPYLKDGDTCPAMVLAHGGGGTAFAEWVRLWNQRGYAAIAIDQCGCAPETQGDGIERPQHSHPGPRGWNASFEQMGDPIEDQWQYHSVSALLLAHTLLAAQPGVDADRVGFTGISWGGYMTCLMAGIDTRLKCAIPVYGCGYLGENSTWEDNHFNNVSEAHCQIWLDRWDPKHYLANATLPMLWVNGTNDFAFPMDSWQRSYRTPSSERLICAKHEMCHSHTCGWAPREIGDFTDSLFHHTAPLAALSPTRIDNGKFTCEFESVHPVSKAQLVFTRATGQWQDRRYNLLDATIENNRLTCDIPVNTTVAYFNLTDDRGAITSSEHLEL